MAESLVGRIFALTDKLPVELQTPTRTAGKLVVETARKAQKLSAGVARRVGEELDNRGHNAAARQAFAGATKLNDENYPTWLWLARSHESGGEYAAAIDAYTQAIRLRPTTLAVYGRRAHAQQQVGDASGSRLTLLAGYLLGENLKTPIERERLVEQLDAPPSSDEDVLAEVLDSRDPVVAHATLEYLLRKSTPDVIEQHLTATSSLLDAKIVRRAIERMHAHGALRGSLAAASHAKKTHPSPWINTFITRRTAEVAQLDAGIVELRAQKVKPVEPGISTKALYLLHNSLPYQSGGYATRTHGLISGMNAAGHGVVGVTRPGFPSTTGSFAQRKNISDTDAVDNVTYHRLISSAQVLPRRDLDAFAEHYAKLLRPFVERYEPSLIHAASNWWNGFGGLAAARQADLPFVYEVRGLWELTKSSREPAWSGSEAFQSDALREASVAMAADRVVTISGPLREELVSRGVDQDKVVLIPNSVDVDRFEPRERDEQLAKELNVEGKLVIGFAGTVTFYEGLDDLLRAIAGLPPATRADLVTLIIGNGPARDGLQTLCGELGLESEVRFVGRVPHAAMPRYLSLFDIVPFPRLPIPVCEIVPPIKPLESMAMCKTVIVSDVEALGEMVIDGETGLHFRKGNVDSLREVLQTTIDDAALRERLGRNARAWAQEERSWSKVTGALIDTYNFLVKP